MNHTTLLHRAWRFVFPWHARIQDEVAETSEKFKRFQSSMILLAASKGWVEENFPRNESVDAAIDEIKQRQLDHGVGKNYVDAKVKEIQNRIKRWSLDDTKMWQQLKNELDLLSIRILDIEGAEIDDSNSDYDGRFDGVEASDGESN